MNFLWLCVACTAFICYALSPPPLWVAAALAGIIALSGILIYVS
jgi:hypothetical protein